MSANPETNQITNPPGPGRALPRLVLMMPLVVVCIILSVSPNFRFTEGVRSAPLGGDFLQEWVGGWMVGSADQDRLYDFKYVQSVQHDPELVGFAWPPDKYFPMVYPPFYYFLVSPMAWLGYPIAMKVWAVLSALSLTICGYLVHRYYPPGRRLFGVCFVAAMFFVPLLTCLNMGQKSTWLLLILSGSFLLLYHGRPFSSGLVFGLIVFKPHLGIVIGVTMLLKRQWRFAGGAMLVVAILVGGSLMRNPELWRDYWKVVFGMDDYVRTGGYQLADAHSLWGGMQLLFFWLSPMMVKWIVTVLSLAVIVLLWKVMRGPVEVASPEFSRQFSAMIFATVVLSPHFYTYDLTILLLPMFLIVTSYSPGAWRLHPADRNLGFVLLAMFGLAGLSSQVAQATNVQASIVLIIAAIVLIGMTAKADVEIKPAITD
jgi:hypothetical protein